MSDMGTPVPGWYPEPNDPGTERWWDGQASGDQTQIAGAQQTPPASSVFSPPPTPGQIDGPADSPPGSGPQPTAKSRCIGIPPALAVALVALLALLLGGCAVLFVGAPVEELSDVEEERAQSEAAALADVVSCSRASENTIILEVVNNSPTTASYRITVAYFDAEGQRLADDRLALSHLHPGEQAVEEYFIVPNEGTSCAAIQVTRSEASFDEALLSDVGECDLGTAGDFRGNFEPSVTVTNGTSETSSYLVEVAILDSDGVRRGSGGVIIRAVQPGQAAPGSTGITLPFVEGFSCEVRAVTRNS